jgi:hypothetical protein
MIAAKNKHGCFENSRHSNRTACLLNLPQGLGGSVLGVVVFIQFLDQNGFQWQRKSW